MDGEAKRPSEAKRPGVSPDYIAGFTLGADGRLTPSQEQLLRRFLSGAKSKRPGDGPMLFQLRVALGISTRDDVGSTGVWLETVAWVIEYRPDLISEDSPLGKALAKWQQRQQRQQQRR